MTASRFRAIAYDFDGVIAESVDVKTQAFRKIFLKESSATLEAIVAYHLRNGGISRYEKFRHIYNDILHRPLPDLEFQQLCNRFAELVVEEVVASPWVEGAQEFIRTNPFAVLQFIVSGTPEQEIQTIAQRRGLMSYFKEVRGSPKSKDAILIELMKTYALSPSDVVYVGDAENDWHSSQRAGVTFVWRPAPSGAPPLEGYTGPQIRSLKDLEPVLKTLTKQTTPL